MRVLQLDDFLRKMNTETFAAHTIQHINHDIRNKPRDPSTHSKSNEISNQFHASALHVFALNCLASLGTFSQFTTKASNSIGNVIRVITIGCQETFCLDRQYSDDGILAVHAMAGLGIISSNIIINSSQISRKFPEFPYIEFIGDLLSQFLGAVYFLVSESEAKKNTKRLCKRFTQHIEASWLFIYNELELIIPADPDTITRQREAMEHWTSPRNRLQMYMRGDFNETSNMSNFYAEVSMTSHCNYSHCLCNKIRSSHPFYICKGCWAVYYCCSNCQKLNWSDHRQTCHRTKHRHGR
ncbi:MYND-type zinc finger protein samB [Abortiporus biennis]